MSDPYPYYYYHYAGSNGPENFIPPGSSTDFSGGPFSFICAFGTAAQTDDGTADFGGIPYSVWASAGNGITGTSSPPTGTVSGDYTYNTTLLWGGGTQASGNGGGTVTLVNGNGMSGSVTLDGGTLILESGVSNSANYTLINATLDMNGNYNGGRRLPSTRTVRSTCHPPEPPPTTSTASHSLVSTTATASSRRVAIASTPAGERSRAIRGAS